MTKQAEARPAEVDPLVLSRRAGAGARVGALMIDMLVPLVLGATASPTSATSVRAPYGTSTSCRACSPIQMSRRSR